MNEGSKFYENELRKERLLQQQISQKLEQIRSLKEDIIRSGELEADKLIQKFERRRCFARCVVHVDMDAFYAAVEIRDQPELRFLPVAVGSNSMLSTSNYIARRFGVRAGLPGFLGKKLCPNLHIIPLDFARYTEASRAVRAVLSQYAVIPSENEADLNDQPGQTEDSRRIAMVAASLDEAYLDLTLHLAERQSWPEERRTFWPRPTTGAKMLVCRCSRNRNKKSHSTVSPGSSNYSDTLKSSEADRTIVTTTESSHTLDAGQQNVQLKKPVDLELAVCDQCGYLLRSGRRVFGTSAWEAVREIRFRVFCATRLTCSAGIGPNTLIAKIASDWSKPMGQFEVPRSREAVNEFMVQMPVRKVPGIGHVSERRLDAFGIHTCGELLEKRGTLWHVSTRSAMSYYLRIALGHSEDDWLPCSDPTLIPPLSKSGSHVLVMNDGDSNQGRPELDRKSMSVERTFHDCSDPKELFEKCRQLAAMLSADLKEEHVKGRHVTLKLKLDTFENRSRSQTLPDYTNEPEVIATFGIELLREEMTNERSSHHSPVASTSLLQMVDAKPTKSLTLRLMGLRMASLMPVEMCPQIRQRSIEEALTQIVAMQPVKLDATQSKQTEDSTPERTKSVKTRISTPRPKLTRISLTLPKSRKKPGKISRPACSKLNLRKRQCTPVKNQKTVQTPRLVRAGSEPSNGSLRWCLSTTQENATADNRPSTSIVALIPATASTSSPEAPLSISCPVCEKQWQVQSEAEVSSRTNEFT
ncbi:DNA polymerase kappa subunit [Fasciola hepatica]|uniref:DNA polymerase kappa n=1 Tax=Fasciola hepatica TaxID=6192 RepID=A0A4E0S1Y7_FASHE|nr:DNA polymerase kappa subunit [Fasciola hepatica]